MTDPQATFKRRDDVVFRQLDDEWVVFDSTTNKLHTLNLTAALVWMQLSGDTSEEDVVREVAGSFQESAPIEQVREDVKAAIARFRDEGLLA